MLGLIRRLVQLAVVATALVQVAGLLQDVHPFFDSIAHFRLHITVLLAIGVALLVALRSFRVAAAALAVTAAGLYGMAPALGSIGPVEDSTGQRIVVVQYNMKFNNRTPTMLAEQVRALKADAVMLEEVSTSNQALLKELAPDYPYQIHCPSFSVGGDAVASRWPVSAKGCGGENGLAWLRAEVNGTPVTFAALHLHWPFPFEQPGQITALDAPLKALAQPVILAGDFNAAPWSHAVARVADATQTTVAAGIRLSFKMGSRRLGQWPLLPIDHVLLPPGARAVDVHIGADAGSDHLPVIATIELAR